MDILAVIFVIVAIFLLSVSLVLLIIGPTLLLRPRRRSSEYYRQLGLPTSPQELNLPAESISITTHDGLKLSCWHIRNHSPARGTVIYLHGVGDCKIDGLRFAKLLHDQQFNAFLFDSRRHGSSEGDHCTYGFYEKLDIKTIIDYLCTHRGESNGKIGLFGTSMGAAVALQAAAADMRISAVVAENSFATLRTIFDDYQKRMIRLPFHFLRNLVIVRSEFLAKFKASDVSPLDAVTQIYVPVLFIYGSNDQRIKFQYSITLHERANEPKEIFAVENANHTDTWNVGGKAYERKLIDFFERNLS